MSLELEQWLLEEYKEGLKEGEDRVAALFKRMKADGRIRYRMTGKPRAECTGLLFFCA